MATGEVTLRIPGLSPVIDELVISHFPVDAYTMSLSGLVTVDGFSAYGTPVISGPLTDRYLITLACYLSTEEALQLDAIVRWSSDEFKAGNDGHLEMDFELEYLHPEPHPHSRTLIEAITPAWGAGYRYGYGTLDVVIALPEDHRRTMGQAVSDKTPYSLYQFSAVEV